MRIYTKVVYDMTRPLPGGRFALVSEESYEYFGPVELCKETNEQDQALKDITSLAKGLKTAFGERLSAQSAELGKLWGAADDLIKGGIGQYGYTAAEDAALRSQGVTQTAQMIRNAQQAVQGQIAAIGGGNVFLPSGSAAALSTAVDIAGAEKGADIQMGITERGFDVGRQNFFAGLQEGNVISQQQDPLGFGKLAESGTMDQGQMATAIANEPTTAGTVGGILGSVAGTALGGWAGGGFKMPGGPPSGK
jgi:hypothetical protein